MSIKTIFWYNKVFKGYQFEDIEDDDFSLKRCTWHVLWNDEGCKFANSVIYSFSCLQERIFDWLQSRKRWLIVYWLKNTMFFTYMVECNVYVHFGLQVKSYESSQMKSIPCGHMNCMKTLVHQKRNTFLQSKKHHGETHFPNHSHGLAMARSPWVSYGYTLASGWLESCWMGFIEQSG